MKTKSSAKSIKNYQQYKSIYFPVSSQKIREPGKSNYGSSLARQSLDIIRKKVKSV